MLHLGRLQVQPSLVILAMKLNSHKFIGLILILKSRGYSKTVKNGFVTIRIHKFATHITDRNVQMPLVQPVLSHRNEIKSIYTYRIDGCHLGTGCSPLSRMHKIYWVSIGFRIVDQFETTWASDGNLRRYPWWVASFRPDVDTTLIPLALLSEKMISQNVVLEI